MTSRRVLVLALVTQGLLMAVAWTLSRVFAIPLRWGAHPTRDLAVGMAGAAILAIANYWVLTRAPSNWVVDGVRAVYHEVLTPLFSRFGPVSAISVGAIAGLGEEWLFRGVLQPQVGWIAASAIFGIAHVGNRSMLAFGVWASGMGLVLGALANATGGLTAPIVAHGMYDVLALTYLRQGAHAE